MKNFSLEDSALDVVAAQFAKDTEDLDFRVEVSFVRDLGYLVELFSKGDLVCEGGGKTLTRAFTKMYGRANDKLAEYREAKAAEAAGIYDD